jgi:hypothetical protein
MRLKSLPVCILIVYAVLNFNKSYAQCSTGAPMTMTVSSGGGAPDRLFNTYNFQKFDPSLGTLIGVDIHVTTSGVTSLMIINGDTFDNLTKNITFKRMDEIEAPGLGAVTISDSTVNFPNATIGASYTTPTWPPFEMNSDYTNVWSAMTDAPDNATFDASIDPAYFSDYSGSGAVSIDYNIYPTFSAVSSGAHVSINYVTLATNLDMTITYTYCSNSILPIGRIDFFAKAAENASVQLSWTKEHEDDDILYGIEMSANGLDFSAIGTMQSRKPASASTVVRYEYEYSIPAAANGKLYFRIRQTDATGKVQYSAIRSITAGNKAASLTLFPNPASDRVTLQFGAPPKNRLQADVINSIGQVVESGTVIPTGSSTTVLSFKNRHAPGVYFIRTIDAVTREQQVSRLIIR